MESSRTWRYSKVRKTLFVAREFQFRGSWDVSVYILKVRGVFKVFLNVLSNLGKKFRKV